MTARGSQGFASVPVYPRLFAPTVSRGPRTDQKAQAKANPRGAPGRPPGEETVVVRVEGATEVDQAATEYPLHQRALLGKLSNRAGLALFRMHIEIRSRNVHIPAQHELPCFPRDLRLERCGVFVERFEEAHFR